MDDLTLPARSLVVAPRMPAEPKIRKGGNPFGEMGDIVVDCGVPGCGWHAMGPRDLIGKAQAEHTRMYHSQVSTEIVTLLNIPR